MKILVDGKIVQIQKGANLIDFIKINFSSLTSYAIALNGEFVPKSKYQDVNIKNGDKIEIVSAQPGG